jgi:hypothetical protein
MSEKSVQTLEQFCRNSRYHLWYEHTATEWDHVTHNYRNGENELGRFVEASDWFLRIDSTILDRSLHIRLPNGVLMLAPTGRGKTKAAARRSLIKKLEGGKLFVPTSLGRQEYTSIPGLK